MVHNKHMLTGRIPGVILALFQANCSTFTLKVHPVI